MARPSWTTTWRGTALLAGLLATALAVLLWRAPWRTDAPVSSASGEGGQPTGELAHLKMLGLALRYHAEDHDGHYPASIGDIEWRQARPGLEAGNLPAVASRFHPAEGGRAMDWLYYPNHTTADPADTILVASPVAVGRDKGSRLVLRVSNATEFLPESEFQRQVGLTP